MDIAMYRSTVCSNGWLDHGLCHILEDSLFGWTPWPVQGYQGDLRPEYQDHGYHMKDLYAAKWYNHKRYFSQYSVVMRGQWSCSNNLYKDHSFSVLECPIISGSEQILYRNNLQIKPFTEDIYAQDIVLCSFLACGKIFWIMPVMCSWTI